jgi:hypothetical protein
MIDIASRSTRIPRTPIMAHETKPIDIPAGKSTQADPRAEAAVRPKSDAPGVAQPPPKRSPPWGASDDVYNNID